MRRQAPGGTPVDVADHITDPPALAQARRVELGRLQRLDEIGQVGRFGSSELAVLVSGRHVSRSTADYLADAS